jgi:hypothetical protein
MTLGQMKSVFMSSTTVISHILSMKEIGDQIAAYFGSGQTPGGPSVPKGSEVKIGIAELLHEIDKTPKGHSNGYKRVLLPFLNHHFGPRLNESWVAEKARENAHQKWMKHVIAFDAMSTSTHVTSKEWLTTLAKELKKEMVTSPEAEVFERKRAEHEVQGVPYPPHVNFDDKVDAIYQQRMKTTGTNWLSKLWRSI